MPHPTSDRQRDQYPNPWASSLFNLVLEGTDGAVNVIFRSMSDEIRAVLRDQAGKASIQRLWKHTVSIVNGIRIAGTDPTSNRRADGEQFGAGCAALWGKQHLILTARHVLQDAEASDLRLFTYPGTFQYRTAHDLRKEDVVDAVPLHADQAGIHRCEWDDLALITVEREDLGEHVEFLTSSPIRLIPLKANLFIASAFPPTAMFLGRSFGSVIRKSARLLYTPVRLMASLLILQSFSHATSRPNGIISSPSRK